MYYARLGISTPPSEEYEQAPNDQDFVVSDVAYVM